MGKAGYLPDISGTFSFYRTYAVNCLERKNYHGATAALYNINSLLTEDFIISIDTDEYNKQVRETVWYRCDFCEKDTQLKNVHQRDKMLFGIDALLFGKTLRVWECPECGEDVPSETTVIIKEKTVKPYFRKVVPDPPERGIGLERRFSFPPAFTRWFFSFLEQLEHQLAKYRIEYISQHGMDMAEPAYKDKGDP